MSSKSYDQHNSEYVQPGKFDYEKHHHDLNDKNQVQFRPDSPLGPVLNRYPEIKIGVDIGCGSGWQANLMSKQMDVVYAMEPSSAALDIAKKIYPENDKVVWMNGFAQDLLPTLQLDKPAVFNSFCVLSHLEDEDVERICKSINEVAHVGSVLSFSECYGCDFKSHLWYVRVKEWWQERFPGWEFYYHEAKIEHPRGAFKAFIGVKKKK